MRSNTITYRATIQGIGPTAREYMYVEVDTLGPDGWPVAAIDTTREVLLEADGLRRLAAVCQEAAEQLDQQTR